MKNVRNWNVKKTTASPSPVTPISKSPSARPIKIGTKTTHGGDLAFVAVLIVAMFIFDAKGSS
jgi:hypothetical protein